MKTESGGCYGEMSAVMGRNREVGAFIEIALHSEFADFEINAVKRGNEFAGEDDFVSPRGFSVFFNGHWRNNRLKVGQLLDETAVFSDLAYLREINALGIDLEIHISFVAFNGSNEEFKTAIGVNGVVAFRTFAADIILK